ncbi:hypothetical protein G3A43_06770 [Paraburkholderia aspalathi]|nr:hypothetical protein [Paraburkholderia aspalathi]MBK3779953.1 hypothetical protein [Paraburkholderia aspalathi]
MTETTTPGDTPEATARRKGAPTPKMLAAASNAATRHGVKLPENADTDFDICKAFLDEYLSKPTDKALKYAHGIAKDKGLTVPDAALTDARELSTWIDANRG